MFWCVHLIHLLSIQEDLLKLLVTGLEKSFKTIVITVILKNLFVMVSGLQAQLLISRVSLRISARFSALPSTQQEKIKRVRLCTIVFIICWTTTPINLVQLFCLLWEMVSVGIQVSTVQMQQLMPLSKGRSRWGDHVSTLTLCQKL